MSSYPLKRSLLMVVIVTASSSAISREISYDYFQGTYVSVTNSSTPNDVDGDGFGVSGSIDVNQGLALTVGFSELDFDNDVDTSQFVLGLALHAPIAVGTDVVGSISALKAEIDSTTVDDSDTGVIVGVAIRHLVTDSVELDAGISYMEIFDDNSTTFGFGARFYVSDTISLGISYATEDDVDGVFSNARFDL